MITYILNMLSVLVYVAVDYTLRLRRRHIGLSDRHTKANNSANPILYSLLVTQETLFVGLRDLDVGVDTIRYAYAFGHLDTFDNDYEPGFVLLMRIVYAFTSNPHIFVFIVAVLSIAPIGFVFYRLSKMPYLSWLVYIGFYYYTFTFSGLRQSIAIALLFLAFYFLVKDKALVPLLLILLAGSFHISALVFLPVLFLRKHVVRKWDILLIIPAYLLVYLFRVPIFRLITQFVYEDYEIIQTSESTWALVNLALFFLLYFMSFFVKYDRSEHLSLTLMAIGNMPMILTSIGSNVQRVANYFCIYVTLALPGVMRAIPKRFRGLVLIVIFVILLSFYLWHLRTNPLTIIDYDTVIF